VGGSTTLNNGRATCPKCNLRKGKKMINKLRYWQVTAHDKAITFFTAENGDKHFVINAAPGAGKTKLACTIAMSLLAKNLITRVIVIAPRRTIVEQWAKEFKEVTGRRMEKITAADGLWVTNTDVCATWSAVKGLEDVFQALCEDSRTLVICDEHHHAAIEAAWGTSADSAFRDASHSLILTGTPVRSDGAQSVWLDLNERGGLQHAEEGMFTLTYGQAVELGYCRPVVFHRHRGQFTVKLSDGQVAQVASDADPVLPGNTDVDRLLRQVVDFDKLARTRTWEADGVTPKRNSYQASMVAWASDKLDQVRLEMPEAGGLVIAPSIAMAKYFAEIIERHEGEKPMVVHSEMTSAERRIEAFRHDTEVRWLVSVGMVAEGVDIQRLRVLVYLPKAMTELAFRQAVGRVVRNYGPHDHSRAYVIMPAVQRFDQFARRIEDDMPACGTALEREVREKICRNCHGSNELGAGSCRHCGADLPKREIAFAPCECGALNRVGEATCLTCGTDLLQPYEITLAEAARDGIISRGMELPEADVREAEALLPESMELIRRAESENQMLASILRTFPLELVPALARLAAETGMAHRGE
jgi:superfamily II DNA or RNA helicase/ribosomal protein L40E